MRRTVQKEKKRVFLAKKPGSKGYNYILSMFLIYLPLNYSRKHKCSVCHISNSHLFFKGLVKIFKRKFRASKETTFECVSTLALHVLTNMRFCTQYVQSRLVSFTTQYN